MSNYIDCQLKVEGTTACLKKLKSSIIVEHDNHYDVVLKLLNEDKIGIISNDFVGKVEDDLFEILENSFENFNLNLDNGSTFYQWIEPICIGDTTIWVDEDWQKLSLADNTLIIKFTASSKPPIVEILLGSLNYSDLKFTLSWKCLTNLDEYGSIEGVNGCFDAAQIKI